MSLKSRIEKFPQLGNKDNKRLYDLSDLLLEVQSAKEDRQFALQFAVYDSSAGVNTIVQKLPYSLQQKWISHATKYKRDHAVVFPPFHVFVRFVQDMAKIRNDPAFQFEQHFAESTNKTRRVPAVGYKAGVMSRKTQLSDNSETYTEKPVVAGIPRCPIHRANHSLSECKTFTDKTWEEKRAFLREKGICFKCLSSTEHVSSGCRSSISCEKCRKGNHHTAMHRDYNQKFHDPHPVHGRENAINNVVSSCTSLCDQNFKGRSCGKIVLVNVTYSGISERVYAVIDDQSNRSLIGTELCDKLNVNAAFEDYTLSTCSGSTLMAGRQVAGLTVSSLDGSVNFKLPTVVECDAIPQDISEIPTPEVANNFSHLKKIARSIPPLENDCGIQLLIGRDLPAAHHVLDQILGPRDSPFALQLSLGWVIIGEICLGRVHQPESVHTYFTHIGKNGRGTIFSSCESYLKVKDPDLSSDDIFRTTPEDNKVGLSAEDRDFLKIMNDEFTKDDSGLWCAPLPFKSPKHTLPNNREQAVKRAHSLKKHLEKNPQKREHLVQFMEKVFASGAAEPVPEMLEDGTIKWYLPLFGIYHPRKKDTIRGVFDSSVCFLGQSLNDQLLSGPNLTNSLLGVLLRFRKDKYAISADVEQMFYRFLVKPEHRDYLRFLWFKRNNPELPLTEFRMRVHVFGNRPSPAVATYGLRKATEKASQDVQQFVARDFYVDDALTSKPSPEEAVHLLKQTKATLQENGQIRLHKIVSNDSEIMGHFPKEELDTSVKDLDLDDALPAQKSLGMTWDINHDMFEFTSPCVDRPFTRRGLLSALNSIFDPAGFVAPFSITGKILLREASPDGSSWDDPLPIFYMEKWHSWKNNLEKLNGFQLPRMYIAESLSLAEDLCVHVYSDASESAIAAAAYVVSRASDNIPQVGFIMGKAKLAPRSGHSIPRLELCAAVLAVEVASFISEQLDISPSSFKFFTDSKVVLGYICNKTRRFYTYVSNRVAQIHAHSSSDQWNYVSTEKNPADAATRSALENVSTVLSKWHTGPTEVDDANPTVPEYNLQCPEQDKEIRPDIIVKLTNIVKLPAVDVAERFSSWKSLVSAFSILKHIAKTFSGSCQTNCSGWHICKDAAAPSFKKEVEHFIISEIQKKQFPEEISCLKAGKPVSKKSTIISLAPYLDEKGMLRVGGRLRKLPVDVGLKSVNPFIIPKGHVATLLVRHFHQETFHQGRHFTEGSIRSNGFWIIGAKRLVSSVLHKCVTCRKLRGRLQEQKMAYLPIDRLTPGPPFSAVGVDVFGPWAIVTRKTRGGAASGKRWAVIFTCLTSRATHIEVIEEMSSSCFINALRRFTAIRGPAQILRSDRGSNFVGAADELKAHVINVEDSVLQDHMNKNGLVWYFNPPHASHMGGVWERAIGIARKILDSMLLNNRQKHLTHEVLCTFMAEVTAVMNSRPIIALETDSSDPLVVSPNLLLTQKQGEVPVISDQLGVKDCYRAQWKHVQVLSDVFWKRWREGYLDQLQQRQKWHSVSPNLKKGDVVLVREKCEHRNNWPVAIVDEAIVSDDTLVRKAVVRCYKDGNIVKYTRPISEMVLLLSD